jgi:preprotein translocase subunit SecG
MNLALEIINVVAIAGTALIIGIILNSRNSIGLVNAITGMFSQTFAAAAGTIR